MSYTYNFKNCKVNFDIDDYLKIIIGDKSWIFCNLPPLKLSNDKLSVELTAPLDLKFRFDGGEVTKFCKEYPTFPKPKKHSIMNQHN